MKIDDKNNPTIPKLFYKQIELRHKELQTKGWDWKSFYNGALEAFFICYVAGWIDLDKIKKENENDN